MSAKTGKAMAEARESIRRTLARFMGSVGPQLGYAVDRELEDLDAAVRAELAPQIIAAQKDAAEYRAALVALTEARKTLATARKTIGLYPRMADLDADMAGAWQTAQALASRKPRK